WEAGGRTPRGFAGDIVAALERVMAEDPDHFGAIHLYIHAVEASVSPERAEPYADRLAAMNLGTGHLVHMPSHVYYRVGRYRDALKANQLAVATDEAYVKDTGAAGLYPSMYYPLNVHFLMASAQMAGDGRTVIAAAEKLDEVVPYDAARAVPLAQPIKAALYFAHAQYSEPETILSIAEPPADIPYLMAMWHYARSVAQVTKGDLAAARAEADAIAEIERAADFSKLEAALIPGAEVVGLAHDVVLARIAKAEGDLDTAIDHLKTAAATEESLIYMEPPYWYYPVRQTLGATLLQAGRVDEAKVEFETALAKAPNSGWALYGLREVAQARNDQAAIEEMEARLTEAWIGDRSLLDLGRL
ncbi:MAG TPA: tetratricopeptide repeat protein, partial [Alphaproteobacteria bacterium]|nr:tetratricopeptide repeat protein [Alphaproteobacteria bacterium]